MKGIIKRIKFFLLSRRIERNLKRSDIIIKIALKKWPELPPLNSPMGPIIQQIHEDSMRAVKEMDSLCRGVDIKQEGDE
jgi:hypothetical protein